eukprot:TRINITY_DN4929_c0_g1_i2.p2 TRINITY_DN4929_c0_g1~~TRINITY_DN4929_c0_g1_i2.p2  ORF type:complete len:176 (+),score=51.90 TRINITY_DN4929_c0_g1_i2:219-746(+)
MEVEEPPRQTTEDDSPEAPDDEAFDDADEPYPDPTLYKFVKRVPQRLPTRRTDIYVSRCSSFAAQLKRAKLLLDSESVTSIDIHGLGAAIDRVLDLSLALVESGRGTLATAATTSSVKLVDEFQPLKDDLPPIYQTRFNSALHVNVFKVKSKKSAAAASSVQLTKPTSKPTSKPT